MPIVIEPLPEPDDDEERIDIGDEAAPIVEALLAEAAVEDPATSEDEPIAATPLAQEEIALLVEDDQARPASKKKRRSRGGAKRTARKRAALAAQETATTSADAELPGTEPDAAPEEAAAVAPPTPALLPSASTDEPTRPTDVASAEPAEVTEAPASTLDKSRRGRSAGQILADQKKRRGGRKPGATVAPAAPVGVTAVAATSPDVPVAPKAPRSESTVESATTPVAPCGAYLPSYAPPGADARSAGAGQGSSAYFR